MGYHRLGSEGKLKTLLKKLSARAKFISEVEKEKKRIASGSINNKTNISSGSNQAIRNVDTDSDSTDNDYDASSEGEGDSDSEDSDDDLEGEAISEDLQRERASEDTIGGSDEESEVDVESAAVIPASNSEYSASGESGFD
ncbi:hypothetical protein PM082_024163 [Marasmius tenuissimus]|nr:hypothetical protein PM082_024163 [Marasmius tenuissimus]